MAACGQSKISAVVAAAVLWSLANIGALGTRVILNESIEPTIQETHYYYRTIFANPNYWDLANAGLLQEADIGEQYQEPAGRARNDSAGGREDKFIKTNFKFNSAKLLEWSLKLEYRIPVEERVALHVYDDASDLKLAAGPQVNQEMCGLHLAYMQAMVRKHLDSVRNTTDYTLFRIMHSSDGPNFGLGMGNNMFLGNYDQCVGNRLSIVRDELVKINASGADTFFALRQREQPFNQSLLQTLIASLGVLVGYAPEKKLELLDKHRDKIQLLGMRYCIAALRYPEWRNDSFSRRNINLKAAICLPETCDSRSLELFGEHIKQLIDFNMKQYYASDYYVDSLYCLPDEQSPLRDPFNYLDTTVFIWFNVIWFLLLLISTLVSLHEPSLSSLRQTSSWKYLSCWCLTKNYRQLMTYRHTIQLSSDGDEKTNGCDKAAEANRVDLEPMEGFKVVSAIAVMASHAVMIVMSNNWNLCDGHRLMSRTFIAVANTVFPAVVDNFFVATGILTVGILMRMPRKQLETGIFWPLFILYRYMRIVPLYALVHWFIQTYFRFLGAGPKWDYGTSRTAWSSMCQHESIWEVIFPMANLKSPGRHCNHVGWYLADDIHFVFLVPILTLVYLKNQLTGHLVVGVSSLVVCANHIRYYMTVEADARAVFEPSMIMLSQVVDEVWAGYVMPQYRCLAFLIGISAGHVLLRYERGQISHWPRWFLVGGKSFIALNAYLLCCMPFLLHLMPLDDAQLVLVAGSVLSGAMHGLTSVAAALFILFLCTGHLPTVAYYFSLDFLKPLAGTALSTLLIHIPLQYYHSQSLTYLPKLSEYNLITTTTIWCLEAYVLSFVVHLFYEVPLRKILLKTVFGFVMPNKKEEDQQVVVAESHIVANGEDIALTTEPQH